MAFGATGSDLHIDMPLTNLVIGFEYSQFIADQVFPVVQTPKETDKYYIWQKGDFARIHDDTMGPDGNAKRVEYSISTDNFITKPRGLGVQVLERDIQNADNHLQLMAKYGRSVNNDILRAFENRVASIVTSTTNVGSSTTLSGATQWSAVDSGNPFADVRAAKAAIRSSTGMEPNLMIISQEVLDVLPENNRFNAYFKDTRSAIPADITIPFLQDAFGIQKILVGKARKNTTAEGGGTAAFSNIWGNDVILMHVGPPDPSGMEPSFGYTFRWTNNPLGRSPIVVEQWPSHRDNGKFRNIQVSTWQDEKIVASELAYLIKDAV
jgi:hypothetical protein